MARFSGKVALITGGNSGIGQATARAFAHEGARVIVSGRRRPEGEATVTMIRDEGGIADFLVCDVTQEDQVQSLMDQIRQKYGRLDIAFNNAGTEGRTNTLLADHDLQSWAEGIDGNLKSTWLSMKAEIPIMIQQGGGAIVNNASIFGQVGMPGLGVYTAAKHGVVGLTQTGSLEYGTQGTRINAIAPGIIWTPMAERFSGGNREAFEQAMGPATGIGRAGQPEEVATAVLWLCSDETTYVHGTVLTIDGGWTAK